MPYKSNLENNFKKALLIAEEKKEKSLFVFDLDSTLFCMKYRTQAIINDCIKDKRFQDQFSEYIEQIKKVKVTERDWSVKEIMSRYGFSPDSACVSTLEKFWRNRFFKNDYLHLDKPYKGCVNFIQHISMLKAKIYYLTARNKVAMLEGTIQSLKTWKFPLEDIDHLIMKELDEMTDSDYKTEQLRKLSKPNGPVLFFENEPVILNQVAGSLPHIHLFWLNSTHSRRQKPPKSALPLSMDYAW